MQPAPLQLGLEFQSFVNKTHALRKVFISVKGIYYQGGAMQLDPRYTPLAFSS